MTLLTLTRNDTQQEEYPPYTFFTRYEWDPEAGELLGWDEASPPVRAPAVAVPAAVPAQSVGADAGAAPPPPPADAEASVAAPATASATAGAAATAPVQQEAPAKKRAPSAQTLRVASLEAEVERLNAEVVALKELFARVSLLETQVERGVVFSQEAGYKSLFSNMGVPTDQE